MEKKIQQHYVWESYLKAWRFNDKQVFCHRVQDKKTFPVNQEKTAKEREFYRLKEFTENDESVIYGAFIKGTYNEAVNMGWVRKFKKVFDMINDLKSKGIYNEEIEKEFEILIVNAEEELHTNIEKNALPILESLKKWMLAHFIMKIQG
ncbi:DUF4238 domain-containing protein [Lysinibacillus sp. GbtcB16]|uniref:DUF4238 domain-containing protein n=1 Tax=Lysinibacillus sp. GbtcB16 TaxID=2824761 RepID=UPI001C30CB8A|nr:DUF4238 domain-containing protein [Lysinibacillus sp. GbtcB16]